MIVEAVKQILAEHETDPNLELTVGDYQTKHYHMCPGAKTLYQDIESKVEDMDLAVRAAKLQDALFAMEELALDRGATEADVFAAETVASQIMSMAEMMGLSQEHSYIQGHVDKIKAAADGMEEAKAYDVETPTSKRTMSFANDQEANDFAKKNINVTRATPVRETHSVGHIDDEPGMLKQFAFDTAEYAVKLYKLLHHYEQMEEQVDFPNWWQHKVMMAREYMSKATHYLEFETMKPQIDAAVGSHSEEELAEDYEPRTKEDLVFQYLRDAWQFGAMKGKDVNPDEELSIMADSLLANLPDYDNTELDEARDYQALVGKTVQYGGRRATVEGEEGDYIRLKFEDGKENLVSKSDFENKEPYVNEEEDAEPSKKDIKAAEKETGGKKTHFTPEAQNMHNIIKNKVAKIEKKAETGEDYKLDLTALKQYISKPEVRKSLGVKHIKGTVSSIIGETITEGVSCCGRCGRVHESAQDCKKPYISKDSPRHCKNKK